MEPIGTSPAQIILGNSVNLDSGIILQKMPDQDKKKRLSDWTAGMLKIQGDIIRLAQASQKANHEEYLTRFYEEQTLFPVNSYVLVNYGDQKAPSKLHSHWRCQYRVV